MEFDKRKAAALAAMNSPEPDNSPKGTLDLPIISLLNAINTHPSFFTTSSCSGRISVLSQPTTSASASDRKKKAKGGTWIFISHDPVHPLSLLSILYPSASHSQSSVTHEYAHQILPEPLAQSLVFRFEPLIIAVECRDVEAAQSLVSLAISCGFRESGITSVSKRVIIAIRCSIRMEVPLGDTLKLMVSPQYVEYLVEVANEKMVANRKRTDFFLNALIKNGFSVNDIPVNGELNDNAVEQFNEAKKIRTLGNSFGNAVAVPERELRSENKGATMFSTSMQEKIAMRQAQFQSLKTSKQSRSLAQPQFDNQPRTTTATPSSSNTNKRRKVKLVCKRNSPNKTPPVEVETAEVETIDVDPIDVEDNANMPPEPCVFHNTPRGVASNYFKKIICEEDQKIYSRASAQQQINIFHLLHIQTANLFHTISNCYLEAGARAQKEVENAQKKAENAAFANQVAEEYRSRLSLMEQEMQQLQIKNNELNIENRSWESRYHKSVEQYHKSVEQQHLISSQAVQDFRHSKAGRDWVENRAADWFTVGFSRCQAQYQKSRLFPPDADQSFLDMNRQMPSEFPILEFNPDD